MSQLLLRRFRRARRPGHRQASFDNMELNMTLLPTAIRAYVYHPLTDGCARFLELFSDTADAPLRCRIFTSYLNDAPPYEALSYV